MNIGICGIGGRMGVAIMRILLDRGHSLGAAFESGSSQYMGQDAGTLLAGDSLNVTISLPQESMVASVDGIIDFSAPAATETLLECAVSAGRPVVIGTTGFTDQGLKKIEEAAGTVPVLFSPNMSPGVNLLFKLTEMASRVLTEGFDVEVFEAHHRFKKDAPSGTAKKLIEIIRESMARLNSAEEISDRRKIDTERTDNEIGVMAMRGGDIVGEHTVFFAGMGERVELTHRALNRDIFARGAVLALEFLADRKPGLYSMFDVLGL